MRGLHSAQLERPRCLYGPRYPVLVHRAAVLLHASFRPRLATTPLRFANPSPPSGWIEDFHLQAVDHARHTMRTARTPSGPLTLSKWRATLEVVVGLDRLGLLLRRCEALEALEQLLLGHAVEHDFGIVGVHPLAGGADQRYAFGFGLVHLDVLLQRVDEVFLQ